ncbi:hypothetical protein [Azospirillum oryzae]|uniref:hypothetical protein n=1 Tax=Azospirillum oryzae TaxID=286727 RepID=UPI0011787C63|nr:hypothetical protein [Azospirillum oryzae]
MTFNPKKDKYISLIDELQQLSNDFKSSPNDDLDDRRSSRAYEIMCLLSVELRSKNDEIGRGVDTPKFCFIVENATESDQDTAIRLKMLDRTDGSLVIRDLKHALDKITHKHPGDPAFQRCTYRLDSNNHYLIFVGEHRGKVSKRWICEFDVSDFCKAARAFVGAAWPDRPAVSHH